MDFPKNGGATIKYGKSQIAVFRFDMRDVSVPCALVQSMLSTSSRLVSSARHQSCTISLIHQSRFISVLTSQEWYATQNVCPHKRALVLSQGIIGSKDGIPKVACPLHKKNFDLRNGDCFDSDHEDMKLLTFPVKIDEGEVWLHLPPVHQLDEVLDTTKVRFNSDCLEQTTAAFTPFTGDTTKLKPATQIKTPAFMKMDSEL